MRRLILGLAVASCLAAFAPSAHAQLNTGFSDPFFLYYGFYLPRQAYLAAQPTTPNQVNEVAVARQNYAMADRNGLYDPNANNPFGMEQTDPLAPFTPRKGAERLPRLPQHFVQPRSQTSVSLPYFNRASRYYPSMRNGSNANRNVMGATRSGRGMGAGMAGAAGMGGMPF